MFKIINCCEIIAIVSSANFFSEKKKKKKHFYDSFAAIVGLFLCCVRKCWMKCVEYLELRHTHTHEVTSEPAAAVPLPDS